MTRIRLIAICAAIALATAGCNYGTDSSVSDSVDAGTYDGPDTPEPVEEPPATDLKLLSVPLPPGTAGMPALKVPYTAGCLNYDPQALTKTNQLGRWLVNAGNGARFGVFRKPETADAAIAIAKRYTRFCVASNGDLSGAPSERGRFVYWDVPSGIATSLPTKPDCLPTNTSEVKLVKEKRDGKVQYLLTDGRSRMAVYSNLRDGVDARIYARHYRTRCFIGRPAKDGYTVLHYWL